MDGIQLRDELVRDRIRQAEEFLDPSKLWICLPRNGDTNELQAMFEPAATVQISSLCSIEASDG